MSNIKSVVEQLHSAVYGVMVTAVIDDSGMVFASTGSGIDIEAASAGNSEVVR